jgi:hypothetical protein
MGRQPQLCLLVLICAAMSMLLAQSDRGVITGTVKDATGAVIPGVQVTATHVATNTSFSTTTTSTGDFTVPSLQVGVYQLRVEQAGFRTHVRENVTLTAGSTVRADVVLEVGTAQQTVEVTATAQLIQADSASVATAVSNTLVDGLPVVVNGASRSPFDLAATAPEVNTSGGFRIAGGGNTWGMTLDGTSITGDKQGSDQAVAAMNSPSVEALTEFTVEAAGFKAETGHASGGTASFVSKSGTNELHGSAFEFLRNEKLDARGFFAAKRAVYKQNNFGATVGGPVWIPKLYNGRDRTFFFVSYEGFRNRVGASATPLSVPPAEFYNGDLHNWVDQNGKLYQVYDPGTQRTVGTTTTRDPFAGNIIPQEKWDPTVKPILDYVKPLIPANVAGLVPGTSAYVRNNYISNGTTLSPSDRFSFKIDQTLSQHHRISFLHNRYKDLSAFGANGPTGLPVPLSGSPGYNRAHVYRGSWDWTINSTWLNRFYGGFNDWREDHGSPGTEEGTPMSEGLADLVPAGTWKSKNICVKNYPQCSIFPALASGDFTTWGAAGPNGSDRLVFEVRDDMTKITGPHTFKWGYFYNESHYNGFGVQNLAGNVGFSWRGTSVPGAASQVTGGGSGFAAMLLGYVNNYSLDTPRYLSTWYRTHQMFFQDDWRVTPRLTLNLGLRYEMNVAPISGDDRLSDLDVTKPNPGAGGLPGAIIFAGFGQGRENKRALIPSWWGGWGPRFSFAYSLDSKTTIRGAATRSFGPLTGMGQSSHNLGFAVRLIVSDQSNGVNPLWYLKDGAPAWTQPPMIDPAVGLRENPPYYNGAHANIPSSELTYAFNIQRQVSGSSVVEVGYLSTLASDITSNFFALNQQLYRSLPANLSPFTSSGQAVLRSLVGSATANAAGVVAPWSGFNALWGTGATVAQAVRPYPQYGTINTLDGGGDRIGHSTYHSMTLKYSKRYSAGLTLQASYVISKILTDADSTASTPFDRYNFMLLKSISAQDQTHAVKVSYVYELPFGPGKRFLADGGVVSAIVGGWRFSGIHNYGSGLPMNLSTTVTFPLSDFNNRITAPSDVGWRGPIAGDKFDPAVDKFLQPISFFGTQPTDRFGNVTRYNPKLRAMPIYTEDISLARTIRIKEEFRAELRGEAFNLLNRTRFGALSGGNQLQNANFGLWRTQSNTWRRMQLALKIYW